MTAMVSAVSYGWSAPDPLNTRSSSAAATSGPVSPSRAARTIAGTRASGAASAAQSYTIEASTVSSTTRGPSPASYGTGWACSRPASVASWASTVGPSQAPRLRAHISVIDRRAAAAFGRAHMSNASGYALDSTIDRTWAGCRCAYTVIRYVP